MRRPTFFYKMISLVLLTSLGLASISACKKDTGGAGQKKPPAESSAGIVIMSKAAQENGGIRTAPVASMAYRKEMKAYGTVTDLQDLVAAGNRVAEAKAEVEKTRARLEASRKAYERSKTLFKEAQDVSAKSLQTAEAAWQSNKADADAAQATLEAAEVSSRQQWGDVIASWLIGRSSEFERLSSRREVLIRLTLPSDVPVASGPATAVVRTPGGGSVTARLVSPSPRTDPRIQGMSFLYLAPARPDLVSGMDVEASMSSGPLRKGILVPASAVVWLQGSPWVYVQESDDRFVRRRVPGEDAVKDGYFTATGFAAGERVVVEGAQVLLSAESLPAGNKEKDED